MIRGSEIRLNLILRSILTRILRIVFIQNVRRITVINNPFKVTFRSSQLLSYVKHFINLQIFRDLSAYIYFSAATPGRVN